MLLGSQLNIAEDPGVLSGSSCLRQCYDRILLKDVNIWKLYYTD